MTHPDDHPGAASGRDLPGLEPGTVLVHIGFYKTGTTALQSALELVADDLAQHGVQWAGTNSEQWRAAVAVTGRERGWGEGRRTSLPITHWETLAERARSAPRDRIVVVSNEYLADASLEIARRIVDDLGGRERVHVVATLRPLSRVLPSTWQESLKGGAVDGYGAWLRKVLAEEDGRLVHDHWRRNGYADLLGIWAEAVGPDRVTAITLDPVDREQVFRSFCQLLGLPPGSVTAAAVSRANRSLTAAEAELLRQVNRRVRQEDVDYPSYSDLVRYGAALRMVEAADGSGGALTTTPDWALDRCADVGEAMAAQIAALGIRTSGDLRLLAAVQRSPEGPTPSEVPIASAVEALLGMLARARRLDALDPTQPADGPRRSMSLDGVPAKALLRETGRRIPSIVRRTLRRGRPG